MILFWDKNTPKTIPLALRKLKPPVGIEYYLEHFPRSDRYPEGGDDTWLPQIGAAGWIVMTQDWSLHTKQNELQAIKQYGIGCFYLWGARAPKWQIALCFFRAYDRIISAAESTTKPFIYRVARNGHLKEVPIP